VAVGAASRRHRNGEGLPGAVEQTGGASLVPERRDLDADLLAAAEAEIGGRDITIAGRLPAADPNRAGRPRARRQREVKGVARQDRRVDAARGNADDVLAWLERVVCHEGRAKAPHAGGDSGARARDRRSLGHRELERRRRAALPLFVELGGGAELALDP